MATKVLVRSALALALCNALPALAASDADIAEIRAEIAKLRQSYETRIDALERRLKDAEARAATAQVPAPVAVAPAAEAPPAAVPEPAATATAASPASGLSAFNPAISAVLQGVYANLSQDPDRYSIAGFVPSGDIVPAKRGFSIAESELGAHRQRRRQGLRQSHLLAVAGEHRRGRGGLRPRHRGAVRLRAQVRALPVRHRLSQRPAPARLGFLRRAARLPGVSRRPVPEQRAAGEMGGADRHVRRVRRRGRQRRELPRHRAQQERHRQRRRLRARRRRRRREQQLARRGCRTCRRAARDREYTQTDLAGNDAHLAFSGAQPARDRRLRLEVGAQRQRAGHQLQAAGRVLLAPRKRRPHLRHRRRARPDANRRLRARSERLLRAGRLAVHADVARRRALRLARSGQRRLRRERPLPRQRRRSTRSARR